MDPGEGWYANGQKRFENIVKNGKREGLQTHWYENGTKMQKSNWKDGLQHGSTINWHSNVRV